jgi:predicted nucleic acid-binding protein
VREQYRIVPIDEQMFELAERLVFEHPLRAYDAVHLATARRSQELLAGLAPDFRFCTADRAQAQAATGEGLRVELIQ